MRDKGPATRNDKYVLVVTTPLFNFLLKKNEFLEPLNTCIFSRPGIIFKPEIIYAGKNK